MNDRDRGGERPVSLLANPLSLFGGWLAGVALLVILFMMGVEATSTDHNPYTGIITFVVLPAVMVFGLIVAGFGAWRERRRRKREGAAGAHWPVLDFNQTAQRRTLALVSTAVVLFLGLSAFGSFKAYEYTESNAFCGTVCHEAMEPEYTAYQNSPHARVHCVDCHIGPGAEWFVRSKLSGAYQIYAVLADKVPRPIHTPIKNLRPSSDTCETCHWPEQFFGNTYVTRDYYLSDDENSHMRLVMMLRVGGGDGREGPLEGIHYHMNIANKIEYIPADDRRQRIDWVRVTRPDGSTNTYVSEEANFDPDTIPEGELRTMDCIDCHNRPSHRYLPPTVAVNSAISHGEISRELRGVKGLAVRLLEDEYETREEALAAIEAGMREAYAHEGMDHEVERAITKVQTIYRQNYFPAMKTSWKAFPDNIGHLWAPGCFRCHGGQHKDERGETISRDCTVCHVLLAEETTEGAQLVSLRGVEYQHPEDIDLAWMEMNCTECHAP